MSVLKIVGCEAIDAIVEVVAVAAVAVEQLSLCFEISCGPLVQKHSLLHKDSIFNGSSTFTIHLSDFFKSFLNL